MASPRTIMWVERIIWTLIFGGMFAVVIGLAERDADIVLAWALGICGTALAAVGVFLIWLRSRMTPQ